MTAAGHARPLRWPSAGSAADNVLVVEGERAALAAASALGELRTEIGDSEVPAALAFLGELVVVAAPGNGFPADRLAKELAESGARRVYLALDLNDEGAAYSLRAAEVLTRAQVRPVLVDLPNGRGLTDCLGMAEHPGDWLANVLIAADAGADEASSQDTAGLLRKVEAFLTRYVAMSDEQAVALALWVLHTHAFDAAHATMYISLTSAEKQCGKSLLLEVLSLLVARPWLTGRMTVAVLARKVDAERPTLLLDESDAAFNGDRDYAEGLRGILNTGHRPSGRSTVCVGQGASLSYRDFSTYCPKAIAGIGELPDTVADRAIAIRLKRRAPNERTERFRHRIVASTAEGLGHDLAEFAQHVDDLEPATPELPSELSDRAQDGWEPLLAIADLAGGEWPARARSAAVALAADGADDSISRGVQLLADLRDLFGDADALSTRTIVDGLNRREEAPWGGWHNGEGMRPRDLARLLKPYKIRPRTVRVDDETPKGYRRDQLADTWLRFLPPANEAPQAPRPPHRAPGADPGVADVADVADADPFEGIKAWTGEPPDE
jgi:hypothetical protein